MKKISYLLVFTLMAVFISACGGTSAASDPFYSDAIVYNDSIVTLQTRIGQAILDLSASFEGAEPAVMNREYDKLAGVIKEVREDAKSIQGFDGNSDLINAARDLFAFYDDICKNEYREIIDLLSKEPDTITEDDLTRMDELANGISGREIELDNAFEIAQNAFAAKYNFDLTKNELQDQIDEIGE
ncbi:MAG: hypothetical protein H6581_02420 [Bacteroidia bacterium]|nr:hypothetical protein [Bacteroidia bacterium]